MVDSYGRIPQAITQGNALDLGTYDQCVSINEQVNSVEIQGKYCSYGLAIPLSNTGLQSFNSQNKVSCFSFCRLPHYKIKLMILRFLT